MVNPDNATRLQRVNVPVIPSSRDQNFDASRSQILSVEPSQALPVQEADRRAHALIQRINRGRYIEDGLSTLRNDYPNLDE